MIPDPQPFVWWVVFQMIFDAISAAEMAALPKELQLDLLAEFHLLPEDVENLDASRFGKVQRGGRKLHRCRAKDYRIYFESIRKVFSSIACCTRIQSGTSFSLEPSDG